MLYVMILQLIYNCLHMFYAFIRKRSRQSIERTINSAYERDLLRNWLGFRDDLIRQFQRVWDRSTIPLIDLQKVIRYLPDAPTAAGFEDKKRTSNLKTSALMRDMNELMELLVGKLQRHFDDASSALVGEMEYSDHINRKAKAKTTEIKTLNKEQIIERKRLMKKSIKTHARLSTITNTTCKATEEEMGGRNRSLADFLGKKDDEKSVYDEEEMDEDGEEMADDEE